MSRAVIAVVFGLYIIQLSSCTGDPPAVDAGDLADAAPGVVDAARADASLDDAAVADSRPADASFDAAPPDGESGPMASDYYYESLGFVDDGPPLFVIADRERFDTTGEVRNNAPVDMSILPAGFTLDPADPNFTSYRYNGPPADGRAALDSAGFIENPNLV